MTEPRDTRRKRLKIRSWRRGTREMDLILGPFADSELGRLDDADLAAYEALLDESDQDLYAWVSGTAATAAPHAGLVRRIAAWHQIG
ncbi:succinate dehydrogenase assembly factor 2 [Limibaculum sp. FT325]|uniref:FAD assembly factor SdhE n=1 Tax=Thermohalobaculum sediminis TaxID=2939436 RepID=UPI0020C11FA2|nr:succinate dehydrogenase assembly factor 2 [Limibaculum sediminis]MCL5778532.1 succinate dehydrogenase assembly factor 2 [Limibaculum sediminis]